MSKDDQEPKVPVLTEAEEGLSGETNKPLETQVPEIQFDFSTYKSFLKQKLKYVEDETFQWDNVVSLLILPLSETDSINKERGNSHFSNIQITGSVNSPEGQDKANDFFPSMLVNSTFPKWRLEVAARIHRANVEELAGDRSQDVSEWIDDKIEIKRRLLNPQTSQNPAVHICFADDLKELRAKLWPQDYLIIAKQKGCTKYEAFGLKKVNPLTKKKSLLVSPLAGKDDTVFFLPDISQEGRDRVVSYVKVMDTIEPNETHVFEVEENEPIYSVGDEIWVLNKVDKAFTEICEVSSTDESTVTIKLLKRIHPPLSLDRIREVSSLNPLIRYAEDILATQEVQSENRENEQEEEKEKLESKKLEVDTEEQKDVTEEDMSSKQVQPE